jgi:hypothetical protein
MKAAISTVVVRPGVPAIPEVLDEQVTLTMTRRQATQLATLMANNLGIPDLLAKQNRGGRACVVTAFMSDVYHALCMQRIYREDGKAFA